MDWIKRNLMFVVGGVITLALLGLAGWYCFSGWSNNSQEKEKITQAYEELKQLYLAKPAPGDGAKVDNIKLAKEQQKEAQDFLQALSQNLQQIPAIPARSNVSGPKFSAALQETISQLQREATNNSVIVPPGYKFSFTKQAGLVTFAPGSVEPLAVQLGEVKAICDILNEAKINTLDSIRRERVPGNPDDQTGAATDYFERTSTTNELAIISPYEVTFQCFTPELAGVLAGFARSPYGLVVAAMNVEPAGATMVDPSYGVPAPVGYPQPAPQPVQYPNRRVDEGGPGANPLSRYGISPQSRYGTGGSPYQNRYATPPVAPAQPIAYAAAPTKSGLQTFLQEKQLKVTLLVHAIKLLPPQK